MRYKDEEGREYTSENIYVVPVSKVVSKGIEEEGEEIGREEKEEHAFVIERAIYDPCKRDFIERELPRMKEWVNRYDPNAY